MSRRRQSHGIALINAFASFAKAMLVIAAVLVVTMATKIVTEEGIKPKAEAVISMSWPSNLDYDIDIWLRDPTGKIAYYGNKQANFMSLERDDMGSQNSGIIVDGRRLMIPNHEEIIMLRGWIAGEYVLNVHFYRSDTSALPEKVAPFLVNFVITKLNPFFDKVWMGAVTLDTIRQEKHVVRFTADAQGRISNIRTDLPVMLRQGPV